jgi:site-specific DNA recombinase
LFDDTGDRLSPVHAKKQSRRYHYYVSRRLLEVDRSDPTGWRLPAVPLERAIVESVLSLLRKPTAVLEAATGGQSIKTLDAGVLNQVLNKVKHLIDQMDKLPPSMRLSNLLPLIEKVEIATGQVVIHLRSKVLAEAIGLETAGHSQTHAPDATFALTLPFQLKRRGVEAHFIVTTGPEPNKHTDPNLVRVVSKAWAWFQELSTLPNSSVKAIAERENIPASEVSRQIPLAFLAPNIVSAILNGEQPVDLTAKRLQRIVVLPFDWELQARVLGFSKY